MFSAELIYVGIIEGLKVVTVIGIASLLTEKYRSFLIGWVAAFIGAGLMLKGWIFHFDTDFWTALRGYIFALVYILSILVLYENTGVNVFGPFKKLNIHQRFSSLEGFVFSLFYFLPDIGGAGKYLIELSELKQSYIPWLWTIVSFFLVILIVWLVRSRIKFIVQYMYWPQFFLVAALLKLISGTGTKFSLIQAVQKGLMKLNHDIVHQTFITIMVPDHTILSTTAWNFIGFLFQRTFAIYMSLIILCLPLIIFIYRYYTVPIILPAEFKSGPKKRLYIRTVKIMRMKRLVPVVIVALYVIGAWFSGKSQAIQALYNPEPIPIIAEGTQVVLQISNERWNLRDGAMHKFVVDINGQQMRFFVIQKPDGTLVACLDACQVCPPRGYAQTNRFMVCLYCRTPIEFNSLGQSGGCNPIPLDATVTDKEIRIPIEELLKKWTLVNAGRKEQH